MKKMSIGVAVLMIAVLLVGCAESATVFHDVIQAEHYEAHAAHREELPNGTDATVKKEPATSSIRFDLLNRDEAKAIAFRQAGVTVDEITHTEVELDYDDECRCWEYEVTFLVGETEYEVELDAQSGTVLRVESER